MIKIVLLTGFLGSGKTTLMHRVLASYQDEPVGVLINEFGEVNVDSDTLGRPELQIDEVSNGSIFCSCVKDNFLYALIEISKREITHLFIEASGLSDPSNMGEILAAIAPRVEREYEYVGAICIVDADSFLDMREILPALDRQVLYSSAVVVNKADLASEDTIEEVLAAIAEINPQVPVNVTSHAAVHAPDVVASFIDHGQQSKDSTNVVEARPTTFTLRVGEPLEYESLRPFLELIAQGAFRIKGRVLTDQGDTTVQVVGTRIDLSPTAANLEPIEHLGGPTAPAGTLVVISSKGTRLVSSLGRAINRYYRDKIKF